MAAIGTLKHDKIVGLYRCILMTNYSPFPKQALVFTCQQYRSFENTVEKEKLLLKSDFSLSYSIFYPFRELSAIFIKFWNCGLQTVSNLDQFKILLFGKELTDIHKLYFRVDTMCEKEKIVETSQAVSTFHTMFPKGLLFRLIMTTLGQDSHFWLLLLYSLPHNIILDLSANP